MIRKVTVYETQGQQFRTFQAAVDHREDAVEQFLRTQPGFAEMPSRHRIDFIQAIVDNRKRLIELLSYDDKLVSSNDEDDT